MRYALKTEIHINAAPSVVWAVLTDLGRYHEWNPFIPLARGPVETGRTLELTIKPEGRKPMVFEPMVIKKIPEKRFTWLGHLWIRGLFDGEHQFELVALADGSTHVLHAEKFSGILVGMLRGLIDGPTKAGFIAMNNALKSRCESAAFNPRP